MKRELMGPGDGQTPVLVLIVGHTKRSQGAALLTGESEYNYNDAVAKHAQSLAARYGIQVEIVYRNWIGIRGAYKKALKLLPDAIIELHFNAFNGKVEGTETLCSTDREDKAWAKAVQAKMCEVFERGDLSRGVKPIARSTRGGLSCYSAPNVMSCLVEPFFGDHPGDCKAAVLKQKEYALALVRIFSEYMREKMVA